MLSACESGIVDTSDVAEESYGQVAAFMMAGASAVTSTLWAVDDTDTALFVVKVYEEHIQNGLSPAKATQKASLWLRDLPIRERNVLTARLASSTSMRGPSVLSPIKPDQGQTRACFRNRSPEIPALLGSLHHMGRLKSCRRKTTTSCRQGHMQRGYLRRKIEIALAPRGHAMKLLRRTFLKSAAAALAAAAFPRRAAAQDYPSRPVRIVAGFAAGGGVDITARLIGQWLAERLGQSFVIENRTGAGGNIGTEAVVNAAPDGYTLLLATVPNAVNASLYEKLNFNFIRDTAPVAGIIRVPMVMLLNPSVPADDGPRVHRLRQGQSGKAQHGLGRQWQRAAYGGRAVQDDGRRQHGACALSRPGSGVDAICSAARCRCCSRPRRAPTRLHRHRQAARAGGDHGGARDKCCRSCRRLADFVPGYEASQWYGIPRPKDTPAEIVGKLNREINAGIADPGMKARLAAIGGEPLPGSPAEFGRLIAEETEKWAKVVRAAGIKPE